MKKESFKTYITIRAEQGEADYQWKRSKEEESDDEAKGLNVPQSSKKLRTEVQENNS